MDFRRWTRDVVQAATNAGEDFRISLLTVALAHAAAEYTEAMAALNDIDGIPERTIPQIRQTGLLALMRATLVAGGESHRLKHSHTLARSLARLLACSLTHSLTSC